MHGVGSQEARDTARPADREPIYIFSSSGDEFFLSTHAGGGQGNITQAHLPTPRSPPPKGPNHA
jgi:hypothetical protein